jgi:hypothetical protein
MTETPHTRVNFVSGIVVFCFSAVMESIKQQRTGPSGPEKLILVFCLMDPRAVKFRGGPCLFLLSLIFLKSVPNRSEDEPPDIKGLCMGNVQGRTSPPLKMDRLLVVAVVGVVVAKASVVGKVQRAQVMSGTLLS